MILHRCCPDLPIIHLLSPNYMLDSVVQTQDTMPLWLILVLNVFFDHLKPERKKVRRKERGQPSGSIYQKVKVQGVLRSLEGPFLRGHQEVIGIGAVQWVWLHFLFPFSLSNSISTSFMSRVLSMIRFDTWVLQLKRTKQTFSVMAHS